MNGLLFVFSDLISTVNTVVTIINIVFIVLLILTMLLGFARGIFKSTFWFAVTLITFVGGWFLLPSVTAKLFEVNLAQFIGTNAHFADETVAEYIQVLVANTLYGDYIIVGDAVCTVDAAIVSEMITYQLVIALAEMVLRIALIIVIFILNVTLFKIIYAIVLSIVKPRKVDSLGNKKPKTIYSRIGGALVGSLIFFMMFLFMLTPIAGVFSIVEKADEVLIPEEVKNPNSEMALYLSYNDELIPLNSNTLTGMIESTGLSLEEISTIANAYRNTYFGKVFSIKFGGIELDNKIFDTLFHFEVEGERVKIRREVVTLVNAFQIIYEKIGEDHPFDISIIDTLDDETINKFFAEIAKLEVFDIVIPIATEYVQIQSEIDSESQQVFVSLMDVMESLDGKTISDLLVEVGNCISKMKNVLDSAGITTDDFNKLSDPELSKEVIAKILSANPVIVKDAFNTIADLEIIDSFKALFVNSMNGEGALRSILTIVPKVEVENGYYTIDGVQTGIKESDDGTINLEQLEGYWLLNGSTTNIKVEHIVLDYTDVVLSQNIRNIGNLYEALYKLGVKSFDLTQIVTEANSEKFTPENIDYLAQALMDFSLLSAFEGNYQTLIDSMLPHELKGEFVIPDKLSKGEFVAIIGIGKAVLESGIIEQAQNGEEIDFVRLLKEYKDDIAEYVFKSDVLANNMDGLISFLVSQTGMESNIITIPDDFNWKENGEEELKTILDAVSMILDVKTTEDGKILGIDDKFVDDLATILNKSKILKASLPEIIDYVNTLEFIQDAGIEIVVGDEEIDLVEIKAILKTAQHVIEITNSEKDVVVELLNLPIEEWDEILESDIIVRTVVKLLYTMTEEDQPLHDIIVLNLAEDDPRWYGDNGELRKIVVNIRKLLGDDFSLEVEQNELISKIINNLVNSSDQDITDLTSSIVITDTVVHQLHSFKYDPVTAPENLIIIPDDLDEDSAKWVDNGNEKGEIKKIIAAAKIIFEGVDEIDFNNISINTIANLSNEKTATIFESDVIVATASKLITDLANEPESPIVITDTVNEYDISEWRNELNSLVVAIKEVIVPVTNQDGKEEYDIENLDSIDIAHVLSLNSEIGNSETDEVGRILASSIITDTIIDQILKQESLVVSLDASSSKWQDNGTEKGEIRLIFEAVQTLFKDDEIDLENIDANLINDLTDNDVDTIFKSTVVAETIIDTVKNIESEDIVINEANIVKSEATKKADWAKEMKALIKAIDVVLLPQPGEEEVDLTNPVVDVNHVLSLKSTKDNPATDEVGLVLASCIITDTIIDQILKQESLVVSLDASSSKWQDNGTEKGEIRLIFEAVQTLFKDDEIDLENIDANLINDLTDNDVDTIFKSTVVAETIIDTVKNIESEDIVINEANIVKSEATKKADWAKEMKALIKAIDVVLLPQPGEEEVDLTNPVVDVNHVLSLKSTKDNPATDEVGRILASQIITDTIIDQIIAQEAEGTLKVNLEAGDERWYGNDGEIRAIFDALKVIFGEDDIDINEFQINGILNLEEEEKLTIVNSIVVSDTMIKEIKAIDSIGTTSLPDDGNAYNENWYGEDGELKKFLDAAVILLGEDADLDDPNYEFDTNRLLQLTEDDKETLLDSLVVSDTLIKNIKTIDTLDTSNEDLVDNMDGTYNANWYGQEGELSRFITAAPLLLGSDANLSDPNYSFDVNRILNINNNLGEDDDEVGVVVASLVIKDTLINEIIKLDTGAGSVIVVNMTEDSDEWYDNGNQPGEIRNLLSTINIILEKDVYGRVDLTNPTVDFDKIYSLTDNELDVVLSSKIVSDTLVLTLVDTEELTTDGILTSAKAEANYSGSLASWKLSSKYREQVCEYSGWEEELRAILIASRTMMVKEGNAHVFNINAVLTSDDDTLTNTFESVIIKDTFWYNMDQNTALGGSLYGVIVYPNDLVKDEVEAVNFVKAIKVIIGENGDIENINNFEFDTFIDNYQSEMLDSRLVEYSMALQVDPVLTGTGALASYISLPANKDARIEIIEDDLDNLLTVIKALNEDHGIDYNDFSYDAFENAIADEEDASAISRTLLRSNILAGSMDTMMETILKDNLGENDYNAYVTIDDDTDWGTTTRDGELYRVLNVLSKVSYFRDEATSFADLSEDNKEEFTAPLIAVSESTVLWKMIPSFVDTALANVEDWKSEDIDQISQDEWAHEIDVIADIVISVNDLGIGLGSSLNIVEDFDDNQIDAFGDVLKNVSRSQVLLIENINRNLEDAINSTFNTNVELNETVEPAEGQTREEAWAIEIDTMMEAVEQIRDIANNGLEFSSVTNILASSLKLARFLDTCEKSVILAPAVQEVYEAQVPTGVQSAVTYFAGGPRAENQTWEDYLYKTLFDNQALLGLFL